MSTIVIRLTGDTSWDDNHVSTSEGLLHSIVCWKEALDLLYLFSANALLNVYVMECPYGDGGDVGQIGGDTWSVDDIVKSELLDERAGLEEEREGLANATGSTCDDCIDRCVSVWLYATVMIHGAAPHLPTFMMAVVVVECVGL